MKKKGSVSDFGRERNEQLLAAFKANLAGSRDVSLEEIFRLTAKSRAPRFYVSERRASEVMSRIERGDTLGEMIPMRRAMFMQIYKVFCEYRGTHRGCSIYEAAFHAVNSEAPEFYLTPESCRVIIYRIRRGWRA